MAITKEEATKIVASYLSQLHHEPEDPLVINHEQTREEGFGWVFFYNSKRFIETRDPKFMLLGNAPVIVGKDGELHETGTAYPIEHYIEEYLEAHDRGDGDNCSS